MFLKNLLSHWRMENHLPISTKIKWELYQDTYCYNQIREKGKIHSTYIQKCALHGYTGKYEDITVPGSIIPHM